MKMIDRSWQKLLKFYIRQVALAHGFLDPIKLLSQLDRFGQPSEVRVPTELLRLGAIMQAHGLINSQAIQNNLDWIWPYWVERQFDPKDKSFIPRAFSLAHINLTHRNWTAVGLPDCPVTPIVAPHGLVTPFWDSWSIDAWIMAEDPLIPSREGETVQTLTWEHNLSVITRVERGGKSLVSRVQGEREGNTTYCRIKFTGLCLQGGWLIVSVRPYNPEGVSFIYSIKRREGGEGWIVNGCNVVLLDAAPEKYRMSEYRHGDVLRHLFGPENQTSVDCAVGMASSAALFELHPGQAREVNLRVVLEDREQTKGRAGPVAIAPCTWDESVEGCCPLEIGNRWFQQLYEIAVRTLILHTVEEAYAGPYTYRRFWFRDAVFIVHALLCVGLTQRAWSVIERFPKKMKSSGYFCSQDGEWDSNGQVLWILQRYCELTGRPLPQEWEGVILSAARWIMKKRLPDDKPVPQAGLFPSGFSAEHLGPSDYYYWDDFWGVAGLYAAAQLMNWFGRPETAMKLKGDAAAFMKCIDKSLAVTERRLFQPCMPASPFRRMDSGAIGSVVAGYPLQLVGADDARLLNTVDRLLKDCLVDGGFFHDLSHSGINPYLTLHLAQVLLRCGDKRFADLMKTVAGLATTTGQWPEAVHPHTRGGCMGDGQHVWAAAEWILMMRNCLVREESATGRLVLCSGVTADWLGTARPVIFGPAPTEFGNIRIKIWKEGAGVNAEWSGQWHHRSPEIEIRMPGFVPLAVAPGMPERAQLSPERGGA